MQLNSKGCSHHPAVMLWLLYNRCGYCYRLFMCVCVLWVLLCFVWECSFSFYLCVHPKIFMCCFRNELMNHLGPRFGMLWLEYVELLLLKTGKNKTQMLFDLNQTMQYSTWESWIPCDTEVQLLCPSKPSPWSKVRRACTQWLPKNLVSRLTLIHCFSSCPLALPSSLSGSGCWVFWLGMTWFPGVSLLSSRGVVNWSLSCDPTSVALPAGATAPCLHLPALEHVGHLGFAVPPPRVDVFLLPLCQSVVGLVLTVKSPCDVSNPVQISFHFCHFCVCVFLLLWQFRDKYPWKCGQDGW